MLMSTSRIEDLLQQHLADDSGEEVERPLVDGELHVLLAERSALLDFRGERGLQARDIGLELRDPAARLGLGARELVGHARELGAKEGRIEVGREELLHLRRLGVHRPRREAVAGVERIERSGHGVEWGYASIVGKREPRFYLRKLLGI